MNQPFKTYHGGRSGAGTFQQIINLIPVHTKAFYLFVGNGGVESKIKPAKCTIINDIDKNIVDAWNNANPDFTGQIWNLDALVVLDAISKGYWIGDPFDTFIYLDPPYILSSRATLQKRYACLYYNYENPTVLHDYSYLGSGFREREANNRVRDNIIKKLDALPQHLRNSILSDIASHYNAILQANN